MKQRPFDFLKKIARKFCTKKLPFASYILSNEGNVKISILLILLKRIVVGCFNGNESFIR